MSAHVWSSQIDEPYNRDLSDFELWERSLRRSQHRREITEAARKHAARRKGAAVAVTASMAVGAGGVAVRGAGVGEQRSAGRVRGAAGRRPPRRSRCPRSSLVAFGDTGEAVAAVQRQVGVDDDGIFGPITRGAVERLPEALRAPGDRARRRADVAGAVQVQRDLRGRGRQDGHDRLQRRRRASAPRRRRAGRRGRPGADHVRAGLVAEAHRHRRRRRTATTSRPTSTRPRPTPRPTARRRRRPRRADHPGRRAGSVPRRAAAARARSPRRSRAR